MTFLKRNWFLILLAIGVVVATVAWWWYFPSRESETAKSQAVSSLLGFITSAILAAMTWLYLQTTRETLSEIRAENLLKVPDIKVTIRGASHHLLTTVDDLFVEGLYVWLHIQNVSRASFSVNFNRAVIDGLSGNMEGDFVVVETTVERSGAKTTYSTPMEQYVYLDEGGAYEGKLRITPSGDPPVASVDKGRMREGQLTGRIYLGFPRDQELEIPFTSR
jgi:hypothetical protein